MARFNEILVGRYNRFLQKLFSMKGDAALFQLSSEMQSVFPFFSGVENRNLEAWDRFGQFVSQGAGGAGVLSAIRFRNPVGSNVIAVFEKITTSNVNAGAESMQVVIGPATTDEGTVLAPAASRLDARGRQNFSLILSKGTVAGVGALIGQTVSLGSTTVDYLVFEEQEIPLLPGDALTFQGTLNQSLDMSFTWRERLLEESERA